MAFVVVIVAVVSNSFKVLLYSGCWRMLEAAVEKLAHMHQRIRKLLLPEIVIPEMRPKSLYRMVQI